MTATLAEEKKYTLEEKVQHVLTRAGEMKAEKAPWLDIYQLLGEFIHMRRTNFTTQTQPGDFLAREIFDASAPKAAKTAASSLLSMLWPQSVKRFRFKAPRDLQETRAVKEYYEKITDRVISVMDNPKAGLPMALDEYMLEDVVFGTAGVEAIPDPKTKVCYKAWGVKHMSIAEGKDGYVDTIYIEIAMKVHRIVKEYGIDKVSQKVRELFNQRQFEQEFNILIAVEPRITNDFTSGNRAMPFQSIHIEMDTKHFLRERGYTEIPIKVARFWKVLGETLGRSPGMDALPDALEANAIWESVTVAIEKNLDPPLGILDDGKLGNGEIDTSAGAINVFNLAGRAGEKNPVFPLFTVGEIKQTVNLLQQLEQSIADHFFIDRLLDFNNETRMTLGEANIRNKLRNSTLGSIFSRQIAELFSPLIERTFNILFAAGDLGVAAGSFEEVFQREFEGREPIIIPDEVVKLMQDGRDVYQIEYFTPALRIMQAEEAEGILRTWEMAGMIAKAGVTQVVDNLNEDESIRRFSDISGAPSEIIRARKDVETMREAREEQAQKQQEMEMMKAASESMRNAGQSGLVPVTQNHEAVAA